MVLTKGPLLRPGGDFLIDSDKDYGEILKVFLQGQEECPWPFLAVTILSQN